MRIVFMGTPDFAVPSLLKLSESSHIIVGVVTQPDRPKGRGLQIASSPVKREAQRCNIPILQPDDLKSPTFIKDLKKLKGESFIVVGFRILPPEIFEMPENGTVNLHASLLPKYRGAAPIQWALMNGEEKTGVTTFFIEKKVDTGDLILQQEVSIYPNDTAGDLHDRLAAVGSELIVQTVDLIEKGSVKSIPQSGEITPAPKIRAEHCFIQWNQSAESIVNQIRALSPFPGAYTFWQDKRMKLYLASVDSEIEQTNVDPGKVIDLSEEGIRIMTGMGVLRFRELQIEGKKRLDVEAFLRGHNLKKGDSFALSPASLSGESKS